MFSIANAQPQVVLPTLSQLTSIWSARCPSHVARRQYRHNSPAATAEQTNSNNVTDSTLKFLLCELGLEQLSELAVESLVAVPTHSSHKDTTGGQWHTSHASTNTFFENKNGFPESCLLEPTFPASLSRTVFQRGVALGCQSGFLCAQEILHHQQRGFKTKYSGTSSGIGNRREDSNLVTGVKDFKQSFLGKITAEPDRDVITRLGASKHPQEVQDKIKIAFSDGYHASQGQPAGGGTGVRSTMVTVSKIFSFFVLVGIAYVMFGSGLAGLKDNMMKGAKHQVNPEEITVTFDDVKGVDEAKKELQDIVEFLQDPEKFRSLGANLPKGVLLCGQPGIGKTLLARAVAGEAQVPFFYASGSEFEEVFVGVGAQRIRKLFDSAKQSAPCVIFIDEIDTVGAKRTSSQLHPYANQTINQLLAEMDGFQQNEGVIVLGATNKKSNLDVALLRPGRFDVEVNVAPPDFEGRLDILKLYLNRVKYDPAIDEEGGYLETVARATIGNTGADLENIINQAAIKAAMENCHEMGAQHIESVLDKMALGGTQKKRIPDEDVNRGTAIHEAGHAVTAFYTKHAMDVHKITILPQGNSLGHTGLRRTKELYNMTKAELLAQLDVNMGGRVAEELFLGADNITTGCSHDFDSATEIATAMVKKYGMSKIGVQTFRDEDTMFGSKPTDVGQATANLIDQEITRILQESYERTKTLLKSRSTELNKLVDNLMEHEIIDGKDIKVIMAGKKMDKRKKLVPFRYQTQNRGKPQAKGPLSSPDLEPVAS